VCENIPIENLPKFPVIDISELYSIIKNKTNPIVETDLLSHFFPNYREFLNDTIGIEMFRIHFSLYHHLYKLQRELYNTNERLYIDLIYIFLVQIPEKGFCNFYDENLHNYCNIATQNDKKYCEYHLKEINKDISCGSVNNADIGSYYLDINNYFKMDDVQLKRTLKGMHNFIYNQNDIEKSYDILGLNIGESINRVKSRYKYLIMQFHPDKSDIPDNNKRFLEIQNAYSILKDALSIDE